MPRTTFFSKPNRVTTPRGEPYEPTEDEIAAACEAIRAKREQTVPVRKSATWTPPVVGTGPMRGAVSEDF